MKDRTSNKWLIRDNQGKIFGPFSTKEVMEEIKTGRFSGDEAISLFPGTDWYSMSSEPDFYDLLLKVLSGEEFPLSSDEPSAPIENNSEKPENVQGFDDDATPVDDFVAKKKIHKGEPTNTKNLNHKQKTSQIRKETNKSKTSEEVIELQPVESLKKSAKKKAVIFPLLISVLILTLAVLALWNPKKETKQRVRLLAPKQEGTKLTATEVENKIRKGKILYFRDTLASYIRSQNNIVQALEAQPKNSNYMADLCLVYFELWPFSYKDSKDLRTISSLVQSSSRVDPTGINSIICRIVDLMLRGRQDQASSQIESALNRYVGGSAAPIALYYLKAQQLYGVADYQSALGYITSAQKLESRWLRLYFLEAKIREKIGDVTQAASRYQQIIGINKNHIASQVSLGLILYKSFRQYDRAQSLLLQGVKKENQLLRKDASAAFLALAEIALYADNKEKSLGYAKKAYSLNPSNSTSKNLIVKLGGVKQLKKTKVVGDQLILEADQFVREGNCNQAQELYKSAYSKNKKNGLAAMKAGQCLWRLSFSTEAISWLNKAIKADSKLIEAYTTLADYYTQRHNFLAAATVLAKAKAESPESHEVYRGYALVEYRRRNFSGAVRFANLALKKFEGDVQSHLILVKALIKLKKYEKAFTYARIATELDVNSREAEVLYAKTVAGVQGFNAGIDYVNQKIQQFPLVTDYRMALAQLYSQEEYYAKAEEVYRQIIELEEKPKQALLELGGVLQRQGKYEIAMEAYIQAAILDPADADPLFESGKLYLSVNKPKDAEQQFLRVKRINKSYPLVYYYLGRSALKQRRYPKAIEYSEEERKKNPNLADSYILAAEAYALMKQYTLCAKEYQKAIRLRPQGAFIYVKLAQCYRLTGNLDIAETMLKQANDKESGLPDIHKELGQIYEMKGSFDRAVEAYDQYLILNPSAADAAQIRSRIHRLSSI